MNVDKGDTVNLSHRLATLRQARGISQSALAKRAGLTRAAVSHLEAGTRTRPMADTVARLARALGVSIEELLG